MPKSKRSRVISLTRTAKKGIEGKKTIVDEIRKSIDEYASVYVLHIENMRNAKLKDIRTAWKDSRFFFGKNKVMTVAFGRTKQDEYRKNLHFIGKNLVGDVGVMFTNRPQEEVTKWFKEFTETDFARSGNIALNTVEIPEGPLPEFSHALEPHLRKLGLPTSLKKGVITLVKPHTICTAGETLKPEQASLLKYFGVAMASFHVNLLCLWSNDTFTPLDSRASTEASTGDQAAEDDDDDDDDEEQEATDD